MAYSDFSLADIKRKFHLTIDEDVDLYSTTPETGVSPWLTDTLQETLPLALAINTEKVRSELIIAPILVELRKQTGRSSRDPRTSKPSVQQPCSNPTRTEPNGAGKRDLQERQKQRK